MGIEQLTVICTSLQEKSKWLSALKPHVKAMNASTAVKPQNLQVVGLVVFIVVVVTVVVVVIVIVLSQVRVVAVVVIVVVVIVVFCSEALV